jgi:hypothetical protein
LIIEATNAFLVDDMETGKALLRDYLNATESIAEIARELEINEKSLRRMRIDCISSRKGLGAVSYGS